ncbi:MULTISPECIES: hypothetical protein [unclassified Dehalobacter]|jgi:hypothetical protein|uniref:hypothetical protein n=1 Tax=unclassified Dehalobacter TaxID=2635733 RepID=UPI00028B5597|nr:MULTISPECIES: hypothetical protein [unclassified Dehalobacter]AFV01106.1 hypothetical protein DHBDCA_p78 [Dehalobacter sp. DCA]AFV04145.1 hypothetical protein DCF50_p139 [Dehalobacter sp. CF]
MEKENNAGYTITDRLSVGNEEFVIGQNKNAPAKFVTWKCNKGEKNYYWGHYCNERLTALEDLCNRALDEIHHLKSLQQEKVASEKPVRHAEKKSREPER